ncbi:MAG: endonuclease VIII [Pegethrix bostrychoides GSE-TBD4-15B]|jgi:endonuclease-8|uniref:DNA-(apurinic or apyrimidinic site) lyase n=1 Tax=Pegethrix bostrychoides GSE-TBD4-15B TaxID=2839662 RepID=A0A951PB86_9CYAN|nr:endonuclease VIII [Pegethrix bostrychoides GSE-TBD4-15B]
MPEGPEIKRAADQIAKAIALRPVSSLFFAFLHLKPYEATLQGREITAVRTKGKAMLIRFDNQLSIYSHNQLYGKWMIRPLHDYPQTNRQLRLAIHSDKKSALLYSASDIEVLDDVAISYHPFLSRLGPDVLDEATTVVQVVERFSDRQFERRGLASLLLDQHFLCGLGNYLRSEVLFVGRLHPTLRPKDCAAPQILKLAEATIGVTRQSYLSNGITNDLPLAQSLKAAGKRRRDYRHYVFGREAQPCYICGTLILKETLAGRRLYYCPQCQRKAR